MVKRSATRRGQSSLPAGIGLGRLVLAGAVFAMYVLVDAVRAQNPAAEFKPLRYEEDYSALKDPAKRTGHPLALERVKYVSLPHSGDAYVSVGGEVRQQYEIYDHPDFGLSPEDSDGYLLQRYMLHADAHFTALSRAFVQLKSAIASFQDSPTGPADEDRLDLHQAFVDLKSPRRADQPAPLTLRLGRQEMLYGSQRIVSVREGPNVRRSFDAFRILSKFTVWEADAFFGRPVETDFGVFDDYGDGGTKFWGVYATRSLGENGAGIDLYYLGLDQPNASFDQGGAREHRHSLGIRVFGEAGALDYNFEALGQWGRYGSGRIRAWAFGSDTGFTMDRVRIGLKADVISGDSNPVDPDLGTFNPLFPRGNYFGESAVLGPLNLVDVHPTVEFQFTPSLKLETGYTWYWRQSLDDGIYSGGQNLIQSAAGSRERYIGHELSLLLEWQVNRHVTVSTSYSHFSAGAFLRDTGPGRNMRYFNALIAYQF